MSQADSQPSPLPYQSVRVKASLVCQEFLWNRMDKLAKSYGLKGWVSVEIPTSGEKRERDKAIQAAAAREKALQEARDFIAKHESMMEANPKHTLRSPHDIDLLTRYVIAKHGQSPWSPMAGWSRQFHGLMRANAYREADTHGLMREEPYGAVHTFRRGTRCTESDPLGILCAYVNAKVTRKRAQTRR